MDIWGIIGFISVGFIFYYILFSGLPLTLVFSSRSESKVQRVKSYLESNGINVYIKSKDMRRFHRPGLAYSDLVDPTLYVIRRKALQLIRGAKRNGYLDLSLGVRANRVFSTEKRAIINKKMKVIKRIKEAQEMINSYEGNPEDFMLPVLDDLQDPMELNMAIITDSILEKGWMVDGYEQKEGYRIYRYTGM